MFEPLLGLLTRGYVAGEVGRWADFGLRLNRQEVASEVMGLCSNPCRSVDCVEQSWPRPEAGAAVEMAGIDKT